MQMIFMHRVLHAPVRTHPRRHALAEAWQAELSEALAHFGIRRIGIGAADEIEQAAEQAFWQWNSLIREIHDSTQS